MTDLHIHTRFSYDCEEDAENYILSAKSKGITCLGFSEHYDYDAYLEGGENSSPLPDLYGYAEKIASLSQKYPDIKILKGIELGYSKDAEPFYKRLLQTSNFDYAILSVHTLKGRGDCYFPEFFNGLTKDRAYTEYLKAVLESVRSEINFQIVGHLGYVERYAPYADKRMAYRDYSDIIDEILTQIINRNKCLEINTSAKGTDDITIPNREIIKRYVSLGGTNFTFGSDAHSSIRFAENFSQVKDFLLSLGVNYTCRFESGKLIKENLTDK